MKEYNLKLTEQEVNTILGALGRSLFQDVFQLVPKIQQQCQEQMKIPEANA